MNRPASGHKSADLGIDHKLLVEPIRLRADHDADGAALADDSVTAEIEAAAQAFAGPLEALHRAERAKALGCVAERFGVEISLAIRRQLCGVDLARLQLLEEGLHFGVRLAQGRRCGSRRR